jgi:hypothetical protein
MTVAEVLAPVAYWSERYQEYHCAECVVLMLDSQPVTQVDAEALAEDCGKTHCDACGAQIAGQTEEHKS